MGKLFNRLLKKGKKGQKVGMVHARHDVIKEEYRFLG